MYVEIILGVGVFFLFVICFALHAINHNIRTMIQTSKIQHITMTGLTKESIAEFQKARFRSR